MWAAKLVSSMRARGVCGLRRSGPLEDFCKFPDLFLGVYQPGFLMRHSIALSRPKLPGRWSTKSHVLPA